MTYRDGHSRERPRRSSDGGIVRRPKLNGQR